MSITHIKRYALLALLILQITFSHAAIPSGYYYFIKNKSKAELKTALHIHCAPLHVLNYGGEAGFTWEGFFYADQNLDGSVVDMYSATVRKFNGFSAVNGMHIEHSLPKSWWGAHENDAYKDLFHLYPADGITNSTKNNLPLGEVSGVTMFDNGVSKIGKNGFGSDYNEGCFEPADEFKGDFARSYFYIATVYENLAPLWQSPMMNNNTYPVWKPWAKELLLKWHRQDPVSTKERNRIEAIYNIQGNRNPFIDYPDLVEYIWGPDSTKIYPFPEETEAFLLTPRRGENIDFGVILENDIRSHAFKLHGVNISSTVNISLKNNTPAFYVSSSTLSANEVLNATDVTLHFGPVGSGVFRDTLIIKDGGLTQPILIPLKALASADFIALEPDEITPTGGKLQWISDPQSTDYMINVYKGDTKAGDLVISAYAEGTSWNKAIELFNGTGKTIDLSKYSLQKQSNGAGSFTSTLRLSGTLPNNSTYVIGHKDATNPILLSKTNLTTDSLLQMNGNDAIQLVRSGVTIDMVGAANAGAAVIWGLDVTLKRKSTVTHPITNFKVSEWENYPIDSFDKLGTHHMQLVSTSSPVLNNVSTGNVNFYQISGLSPENTYTYSITSMRSGSNIPAINTMQLHTSSLEAPVAMSAMNISSTSFIANWEEDLHTSDYLLDVFSFSGQETKTEIEEFLAVGANGTPLPTGWKGTASGNYPTAASSGNAAPSVSLKYNNEWLKTKTYPFPVTKLTYMYRFASAATGSSIIVQAFTDKDSIKIDSIAYNGTTAKIYPTYNFTADKNFTSFKFTYKKTTGNLAIDDVSATYGGLDTVFVYKNKTVNGAQFEVTGLNQQSAYAYRVRSILDTAVSGFSETINVHTLSNTNVKNTHIQNIKLNISDGNLSLSGLMGNEIIRIYTITGVCIYQQNTQSDRLNLNIGTRGIFIVEIQNNEYSYTTKIINN